MYFFLQIRLPHYGTYLCPKIETNKQHIFQTCVRPLALNFKCPRLYSAIIRNPSNLSELNPRILILYSVIALAIDLCEVLSSPADPA